MSWFPFRCLGKLNINNNGRTLWAISNLDELWLRSRNAKRCWTFHDHQAINECFEIGQAPFDGSRCQEDSTNGSWHPLTLIGREGASSKGHKCIPRPRQRTGVKTCWWFHLCVRVADENMNHSSWNWPFLIVAWGAWPSRVLDHGTEKSKQRGHRFHRKKPGQACARGLCRAAGSL